MKYLTTSSLIILLLICVTAVGMDLAKFQEHQQKAIEAYQSGDLTSFVSYTREALKAYPQSPPARYNLACGLALTGRHEEALVMLRGLAEAGIDYGIATDPDFESLRALDEFKVILALAEKMTVPISHSKTVYELDQIDMVTEGLAWDPIGRRFFIGSMRHGNIMVIDSLGSLYQFARVESETPISILGLEVDTVRRVLWAAGTAGILAPGYREEHAGITGVFGFDLTSGETKHAWMLDDRHIDFGFNDLTVSTRGDIFLSGGPVYRVAAGSTTPVMMLDENTSVGSNGITLSADERTLFVSTTGGILAVDMASGERRWLEHPDSLIIGGFDGMYYHKGCLVGIQYGAGAWRAVQMHMNADETAVDRVTVLEQHNPNLSFATTGALVGDTLYFLSRSLPPDPMPEMMPPPVRRWVGRPMILKAALH